MNKFKKGKVDSKILKLCIILKTEKLLSGSEILFFYVEFQGLQREASTISKMLDIGEFTQTF